MQCTCIPSSHCCVQNELGMQVHCTGGQRGGCHHFVVGLCSWVSHPCLDSVLFTGPALTWNAVFSETFPSTNINPWLASIVQHSHMHMTCYLNTQTVICTVQLIQVTTTSQLNFRLMKLSKESDLFALQYSNRAVGDDYCHQSWSVSVISSPPVKRKKHKDGKF